MKIYELPTIEIVEVTEDIVTKSPGTELPVLPDWDFKW